MATGIARSGWDIDLRDGIAREDSFARMLMDKGIFLIEHKCDEKAEKTGNVFIEFTQLTAQGDRIASGIAVTTADAWAIEFRKNWHISGPMSELKEISREAWKRGCARMGGDNNCYQGVVFPLEWLLWGIKRVRELPIPEKCENFNGPHRAF